MQKIKLLTIIFFSFVALSFHANATHIRAGEVIARKINQLTFEFTVVLYTDSSSNINVSNATLDFGDNTRSTQNLVSSFYLTGYRTVKNTYKFIHTYSSAGNFRVGFTEKNRTNGTVNIQASDIPFYVETQIIIDAILGQNSSPLFTTEPIDFAAQFRVFTHNPGAYDPDGDSLVFSLGVPQRADGVNVPNYSFPLNFSNGCTSQPVFKIDSKNGDLTWDTPCLQGFYSVVIICSEYRRGFKIGYIKRDMQIYVQPNINRPPVLKIPSDTCITAGKTLNKQITATDPDLGDRISMTTTSGVYTLTNNVASASIPAPNPQNQTARINFAWNTSCVNVREQPYIVTFKAVDNKSTNFRLSDQQSWTVKIIGPKLENLKVSKFGSNALQLNWDSYACQNASKLFLYRKNCKSNIFVADSCDKTRPENFGFKKIAEISPSLTSYLDNNNGAGLEIGVTYCYVMYAVFPEPGNGVGRISNEACGEVELDVPVLLNITVDSTDSLSGKISLRWTKPRNLNTVTYPGPYSYKVLKANVSDIGLIGAYSEIASLNQLVDTFYVDSNFNTKSKQYNYKIAFYYSGNILKDESKSGFSVFGSTKNRDKQVILMWNNVFPWNTNSLYQYIYRKIDSSFVLIDSVLASGNKATYTDKGTYQNKPLINGVKYHYYITTKGQYGCPDQITTSLLPSPLLNNSQIISAIPRDTIPPCPPRLGIDLVNCDNFVLKPSYENYTYWHPNFDPGCDTNVKGYNLYFKSTEEDDFKFLIKLTDTTYLHQNLPSLAGCYTVTAFDQFNNESKYSNVVCNDNCEYFDLPNFISPNDDKENDLLRPVPKSRYVNNVKLSVYNRWGKLITTKDGDPWINWDGKNDNGDSVSDGIYFIKAEVTFDKVSKNGRERIFKKWLMINK